MTVKIDHIHVTTKYDNLGLYTNIWLSANNEFGEILYKYSTSTTGHPTPNEIGYIYNDFITRLEKRGYTL